MTTNVLDRPADEFSIPAWRLDALQDKFAALTKRAAKLGVDARPALEVIGREIKTYEDQDGFKVRYEAIIVRVTGVTPKLTGWTLVGVLEHTEAGNIVRSVPGAVVPESYRVRDAWCDHCQTSRQRIDTILVQHEDGMIKQVGSSCVKDFLGHQSVEQITLLMSIIRELREHGNGYGSPEIVEPIEFLIHAAAGIRTHGWVSRKTAEDTDKMPSVALASQNWQDAKLIARGIKRASDKDMRSYVKPVDADVAFAKAALEWAKGSDSDTSEYRHNLRIACSKLSLESRDFGIVTSVINAYQRAQDKLVERSKTIQTTAHSEHVGSLKDRLTIKVTVTAIYDRASDFGPSYITKMVDDNGNNYVWFATSERLTVGQTYNITGTVKGHNEFRGVKETILTRCKVVAAKG